MTSKPTSIPDDALRLKGKTLRGKNRINRGGEFWIVAGNNPRFGLFLESVAVGRRECFWMQAPSDPHVEVVA